MDNFDNNENEQQQPLESNNAVDTHDQFTELFDDSEQSSTIKDVSADDEQFIITSNNVTQDQATFNASRFLYMYYHKWVQIREFDLLDQCGARDLICIDAAALLEEFFDEDNSFLDTQTAGGQCLHFTWLLEQYILNLKRRDIQFEVLIFKEQCAVASKLTKQGNEKELAIQSVHLGSETKKIYLRLIETHLQHLDVKYIKFDHWFDNESYTRYVQERKPSLIVGNKHHQLYLMATCFLHETRFATDLRFTANTIMAMATECFYKAPLSEPMIDGIKNLIRIELISATESGNQEKNDQESNTQVDEQGEEIFKKIECLKQSEPCKKLLFDWENGKIASFLYATAHIVAHAEEEEEALSHMQLCQLTMASLLLQASLPLKLRAQQLGKSNPILNEFVADILFFYMNNYVLNNTMWSSIQMHDFFDGRLFTKLCSLINPDKLSGSQITIEMPTAELQEAFDACQKVLFRFASGAVNQIDTVKAKQWWKDVQAKSIIGKNEAQFKREENQTIIPFVPVQNDLLKQFDIQYPQMTDEEAKKLYKDFAQEASAIRFEAPKDLEKIDPFVESKKWKVKDAEERLNKYGASLIGTVNEQKMVQVESNQTEESSSLNVITMRLKSVADSISKQIKDVLTRYKSMQTKLPKFYTEDIISDQLIQLEGYATMILERCLKPGMEAIAKNSIFLVKLSNVNQSTTKQQIEEVLQDSKTISALYIHQGMQTATIYFDTFKEAKKAILYLNKKVVNKSAIKAELVSKEVTEEHLAVVKNEMKACYTLLIQVLFDQLELHMKRVKEQDEDELTAKNWALFEHASVLYQLINGLEADKVLQSSQTKTYYKDLITTLLECNFFEYAQLIEQAHPNVGKLAGLDMEDNVDHVKLQLAFNSTYKTADHYFINDSREKKTEYITKKLIGFIPDDWQNTLISHVNVNKSVLCTAPTSSGKTFIAYYLINRILKASDDDVIVFVFPLEALVNQGYAEIFSRFKKTFKNNNELIGVYTRDIKLNVLNSQVLITLPTCLEELLLSPHTVAWQKKIKYVVLDEIHCINLSKEGSMWEHILTMISAPFVALSATIGNTDEFRKWLQSIDVKEVELVQFHERPRPLEYAVFEPKKGLRSSKVAKDSEEDEDEDGKDSDGKEDQQEEAYSGSLHEVHPCAVLSQHHIDPSVVRAIPNMSPRQAVQLIDAATQAAAQLKDSRGLLERFTFDYFAKLRSCGIIPRAQVQEYCTGLKKYLATLAEDEANQEMLLKIFAILRSKVDKAYSVMQEEFGNNQQLDDGDHIAETFPALVETLLNQGLLPALAFSFDGYMIRNLFKHLLLDVYKTKRNLWKTPLQKQNALQLIRPAIDELRKKRVDEVFLVGLQYGVAMHSNRANINYLTEIERLYRMGVIPVMIATGTLSLGINMPAKSVVMCGYSQYLHVASKFAQCAGRAGRRGYDSKGVVVFHGFNQTNMNRLLSEPYQNIMGSTGISSTFIMQLLSLFGASNTPINKKNGNDKFVISICERTMKKAPFLFGSNDMVATYTRQLPYHVRFAIELLSRLDLIDIKGKLTDFAPLAISVGIPDVKYHRAQSLREPENFMLIHLLKSGVLHKMLHEIEQTYSNLDINEGVSKTLIKNDSMNLIAMVICFLFARGRKTPCTVKVVDEQKQKHMEEESKVLKMQSSNTDLQASIQQQFESSLKQYEDLVLAIFEQYVNTFAKTNDEHINDEALPASGMKLSNQEIKGALIELLKQSAIPFNSCSSFAALSGNHDKYKSLRQLLATIRHTILLPFVPAIPDISKLKLNKFLVDFLHHGSIQKLSTENQFFSTKDASAAVMSIRKELLRLQWQLPKYLPENDILLAALNTTTYTISKHLGFVKDKIRVWRPSIKFEQSEEERIVASRVDKRKDVKTAEEKVFANINEKLALKEKSKSSSQRG